MKLRFMICTAVMVATAGSAMAQTARSYMPSDFDILLNKSIFNKDRRPLIRNANGTYGPDTRFIRREQPQRTTRTPALRGILRQEDDYVALLEEPRSNSIEIIRKGDELPNNEGVVTDITLDDMGVSATADQPVRRIKIGQNLHGATPEIEVPAAAASTGSDNTAGNSSGSNDSNNAPAVISNDTPPTPPSAPSSGGTSLDEIKARMMAKRRQQNGGK